MIPKFRVFVDEKIREVYAVKWNEDGCFVMIDYGGGLVKTFPVDEVKLMQFTGLLDKNGKEIYEGDILNYCDKNKTLYIVRYGSYNCNSGYKSLEPQYIGASFYLEVVNQELLREDLAIYSHNDYAFLYPVTEDFRNFEEYTKNWGLAVIGNIHENPELINR